MKIEDAKRLYAIGGESKDIALEYFPELKERTLPKTWEEFEAIRDVDNPKYWLSQEIADCMDALSKLYLLKQEYNGDWVADYEDETQIKHSILLKRNNQLSLISRYHVRTFLAFKSPELRDQFAANFKELIEAAKPLLG